jgi:hypothetical protein
VKLALAALAALAASGCLSGGSAECASDGECAGGDVCARTGECVPAGGAIEVVVEWTVGGAAPDADRCAPVAELEVVFYDGREEATSYAPVPCTLGRTTYDKMPPRLDRVELFAYDDRGAVLDSDSAAIDGTTTVSVDLEL